MFAVENEEIIDLDKSMKYWKKYGSGTTVNLKGGDGSILDVTKITNGIRFTECCDEHFYADYTKQEALELIEELKQWIEKEVE